MQKIKVKLQGAKKDAVLTFIFFVFSGIFSLAYAAIPTVGTISPTSGTTTPDLARSFSTTYSDTDGWANLKEAYLLISTSQTTLTNSAYLYYDQNTNLLYLRNDANTGWLGGYAPGSANTIENSYVRLNCASSTATGSVSTLTISWNLSFKPAYSGKKYNTYLSARDDTGGLVGLTYKGTYTVNRTPSVGTITPSTGTGQVGVVQNFTATYADTDGWQNIQYVRLLINSSTRGTNCFYGYYNQNTNLLYLRNDANTAWLGGYLPGSSNVIENSYARLDCSQTSISGTGTTLTVNWRLTLKTPFTGSKNTYLFVADDLNVFQGWIQRGAWSIPNNAPSLGTLSPSLSTSSPNQTVIFSTDYSDPDTWLNIQYVYLLINTSTSRLNCFYGYYNQNTNLLYLRNDANTAWLGGYAPGSANIIENSYVRLSCASTTISGTGNTLSVNWSITPKSTFTGAKYMYLYVADDASSYAGFTQKGTWSVQSDITPPTGTIAINNGNPYTNSSTVTLILSATDTESGMGASSQMQFSNDGITWLSPESYAAAKTWTLTAGEGQKTVYVKYKDAAGNWSGTFSSSIILDTTAPSISLNPITSPTNQDVTLSYTVIDNFTPPNEITLTGNNSPYTSEAMHNVTLTAQDKAGNSASASLSFIIDKTPPVVVITSPQDGQVIEDTTVTLAGTVDGLAFSETRTLIPGDNLLTKTATDTTGNSASSSINVYVYLGQVIGPEGGEVFSSDGKVRVIIPQGALTTAQQIRILKLSSTTIQNTVPLNTSLLSAVECKPYGLVFLKQVQIIYTLSQAEIPGTPVELGLYDSIQNKILSTGQTSTVPQDGYSLNFSISHFSTYAALKNLIAQSTPIGAYVKIPLPDLLTGSFSTAIPISVPPGRKGIQPALSLSYRSSNPNSWTGLGFSLNTGYIVRSTRLGPATYNDTTDTFYFITDAGTTELVHLIDNLYQAKIESGFSKFYKESDDTWKVVAKDGSSLEFAKEANAKETSTKGTFSWYLTKAKDTNGNYVSYHYITDQGKCYLNRIDYTGNDNGIAPANSVEFILEPRQDISSSYISTARVVTGLRLKEIQVKVNLELVWRYVLEYTYSLDTNRSLLTSVKQLASDGKMLPVQRLTYQKAK